MNGSRLGVCVGIAFDRTVRLRSDEAREEISTDTMRSTFSSLGCIERMTPSITMKHYWIAPISLFLSTWSLRADETNSTLPHATAIGESVLRLLEVLDAERFANA